MGVERAAISGQTLGTGFGLRWCSNEGDTAMAQLDEVLGRLIAASPVGGANTSRILAQRTIGGDKGVNDDQWRLRAACGLKESGSDGCCDEHKGACPTIEALLDPLGGGGESVLFHGRNMLVHHHRGAKLLSFSQQSVQYKAHVRVDETGHRYPDLWSDIGRARRGKRIPDFFRAGEHPLASFCGHVRALIYRFGCRGLGNSRRPRHGGEARFFPPIHLIILT